MVQIILRINQDQPINLEATKFELFDCSCHKFKSRGGKTILSKDKWSSAYFESQANKLIRQNSFECDIKLLEIIKLVLERYFQKPTNRVEELLRKAIGAITFSVYEYLFLNSQSINLILQIIVNLEAYRQFWVSFLVNLIKKHQYRKQLFVESKLQRILDVMAGLAGGDPEVKARLLQIFKMVNQKVYIPEETRWNQKIKYYLIRSKVLLFLFLAFED